MITLPPLRIVDVLDIVLVAAVIYKFLSLIRGTRAVQILLGLAFLLAVYAGARAAGLLTFQWIMGNFLGSLIVLLAVVFQSEIRRGLAKIGQSHVLGGGKAGSREAELLEGLSRAAFALSREKTGALVLLEREMGLKELAESGHEVDARFSSSLLVALFLPGSPLHDGAVLVRDGRIARAGIVLPMATESLRGRGLGTRHRAALGIASETDAVALVVSEETGRVTVFHDREGTVVKDPGELSILLATLLGGASPPKGVAG